MSVSPPFDTWPVRHFDPRFGYAWYCGKGIIVAHMTATHGSELAAHAYHDFESAMLEEHAEEIERHGGLYVIHDWRGMVGHDAAGRKAWQQRMEERPRGYLRGSVVCLAKATPVLRMAVQAVNLYSSVAYGAKVEISTNVREELRRHGVRNATAT